MKTRSLRFAAALFMASVLFTACEKDPEGEDNEEEVITTMQLTFVPMGGGNALTFKFDDPDGPGGAAPTQDQIVLAANKTYNVTVQFLDKTKSPAEDMTTEVAEEADAHRIYYQPSQGSNITVSGLNNDAAGVPLGINSTWATTATATGTVKVTLRHYPGNPPNKQANDPVDSNKSSTDIEVTFNTKVQ